MPVPSFTPGPHEVFDETEITARGAVIARVLTSDHFPCLDDAETADHLDEVEAPATARLYAAPTDLYAACEAASEKYQELSDDMDTDYAAFFTAMGAEHAD